MPQRTISDYTSYRCVEFASTKNLLFTRRSPALRGFFTLVVLRYSHTTLAFGATVVSNVFCRYMYTTCPSSSFVIDISTDSAPCSFTIAL